MSDPAELIEPATAQGRWLDDVTRSALQLIADALVELAGFEVAGIAVARDDGQLYTAVVSGRSAVSEALIDVTTSIERLEADLARGDRWGRFCFLPQELRGSATPRPWAEESPAGDTPDAWQPYDLLVARLHDGAGELRATLGIDVPEDGKRPGPERRTELERFAAQAERAVVSALERARLADQVRLVEATREVIRQASRSIDVQDVLDSTGRAIMSSYGAAGAWLRLFGPENDSLVITRHTGHPVRREPADARLARRSASKLWARQQVGLVYPDELVNLDDDEDNRRVQRYLGETGIGSVMLIPLSYGEDLLGSLTLTRAVSAPRWSTAEIASAFALGAELAQLVLNAQAYARERQVASELRTLDAYKNQLISTVTRELRRPLSAIVEDLDAIRRGGLSTYAGQALEAMERTSARMVRLVEDLMLLSRVVDPEYPLTPEPVDLAPIVRDVSELSQVAAREHDLSLRVRTPAFTPVLALGDAAELDRVVVNLVSNAVKYTRDGGTITLTLRNTRVDRAPMVELIVDDDGIGISEADQARLFTEFFRSTNPAALVQPGTGLGLTIVERVVRRHGGRIEIESALGVGTTVRVLLPAAVD